MQNLIGYSERGLVNALVEGIIYSPDPGSLLKEILDSAWLCENRAGASKFETCELVDFEIVVEHSLSDFGDPDILIFLERRQNSEKIEKLLLYIEAKNCQWHESSPLPDKAKAAYYESNASSIIHELFLKACFHDVLSSEGLACLEDGFCIYQNEKLRKIGKDAVVRRLVDRIAEGWAPRFFALTADKYSPELGQVIDTQINDFSKALVCAWKLKPILKKETLKALRW